MKPARYVRSLFDQSHVTVAPKVDDRTINDALSAFERRNLRTSAIRSDLWRIIMRSRITRLTVAGAVCIVVIVALHGGSVDVASTAIAQMTEAVRDVPCVHAVIEGRRGSVEHVREQWLSFESGRMCKKHPDGRVECVNLETGKRQVYSPDSGAVIISRICLDKESVALMESAHELLPQMLTELGMSTFSMQPLPGPQEGEYVYVYRAELPETGFSPKTKIKGRCELVVDHQSHLPLYAKLEGYGPDGAVLLEGRVSFDYPPSMPNDIYDLGVPRTADVIDSLPGPAVGELLETYRAFRDSVPSGKRLAIIRDIRLPSGKSNVKTKVVEGTNKVQSELQREGWDSTILGDDPHITEVVIVEDDYSREKNLICVRVLRDGYKRPGMVSRLPFKGLFYINADRDYICEKYEIFALRRPTWQGGSAWMDENTEQQCSSVSEVVRYGRTTSGKWYPKAKKAQTTVWNEDGTAQEYTYNIAIYLDTDPE
jgi:hypothetical protein